MTLVAAALCAACIIQPDDDEDQADADPTMAGTGGPSSADTGGEAGEAGEEGEAGEAGDSAVDDSTGATDPSDSGGDDGMFCVFECEVDEDCYIGGADAGLTCEDNRCTGGSVEGCADDDFCIAQLSGWSAGTACSSQGECAALMQSCIDVDGAGHCVISPSDFFACADAGMEEIELDNVDGDPVTVCGNTNAECRDDGTCFSPCHSDDDCYESAPQCDTATGFCGCTEDADCETLGIAAVSVCLDTGVCGCGTDDDCTDAGGDVCTSYGVCGCSGDAACEDVMSPYDGTTVVCAGA